LSGWWWAGVVHGDLGGSIRLHDSVGHLIVMRYPYTLALAATALVLSLVLALPAGIMAAVRRGRWVDQTLSVVSLFGLSVPGIALGPVLILIFQFRWDGCLSPARAAAEHMA
jgi:ABC-type dipeptide/oligopeptide/nickel transport system permease component